MKKLLALAVCLFAANAAFANTINISTGVAAWQVYTPYPGPGFTAATALTAAQSNVGSWAVAPAGSTWISYGSTQGISCTTAATGPANGCASTLLSPGGDIWTYTLAISAASLGATSGLLNFVFGADNRVNLFVGNQGSAQQWAGSPPSQTNGTGFNPLGCSGNPPTSAGNSQASYNNCTGTTSFSAADLAGDGSLMLTAYVFNDPISGCPACGNPTGFVLEGSIVTGQTLPPPTPTPEPPTVTFIALAAFAGLLLRFAKPAEANSSI